MGCACGKSTAAEPSAVPRPAGAQAPPATSASSASGSGSVPAGGGVWQAAAGAAAAMPARPPGGAQGQHGRILFEEGPFVGASAIDLLPMLLDPRILEQLLAAQAGMQAAEAQPSGPPPTSARAMRALPRIKVTAYDIQVNENKECTICLEDLEEGQPAVRIPCGHLYHEHCIKDWLRTSNECPACRYELHTDDKDYERGRLERMASRQLRMRRGDLVVKTNPELRRLAEHLGVDLRGCLEKSEVVDAIAHSPKVHMIVADESSLEAGASARGLRILTPAQIDELSDEEVKSLMDELGVDHQDCADKAEMVHHLTLSGRVVIAFHGG